MRRLIALVPCLVACSSAHSEEPADAAAEPVRRTLPAIVAHQVEVSPARAWIAERSALVADRTGVRPKADAWKPLAPLDVTLPITADGEVRLALGNARVSMRAEGLAHAGGGIARDMLIFPEAATAVDVMHVASANRYEELRVLRSDAAKRTLHWSIALENLAGLRVNGAAVEAFDASGRAVFATDPLRALDADGKELSVTIRVDERESRYDLVATVGSGGRYPIFVDPGWRALASVLPKDRNFDAAVIIDDGRVVIGSGDITGAMNSLVFDPATNLVTVGGAQPVTVGWTSLVAASGTAWIVGGACGYATLNTLYKLDPATLDWSAKATMAASRRCGATCALSDGRIFATEGDDTTARPAEIYDPVANTWTAKAVPPSPGLSQARCAQIGSKVYVFGQGSMKVYDPATDKWSLAAGPIEMRQDFGFAVSGSKIAIAGGQKDPFSAPVDTIDLFDTTTSLWTRVTGTHGTKADRPGITALTDGRFLVVGGGGSNPKATTFVDPTTATATPGPNTAFDHVTPSAVTLSTKAAVVFGHTNDAELYLSLVNGDACVSASECNSGRCVDGVCCNTVCDGPCTSCALPGKKGTCSVVDGIADPHGVCPSGPCADVCKAGSCTVKASGVACGTATCTGATLSAPRCDGTSVTCGTSADTPCPGSLKCADGASCRDKCVTDFDCAGGVKCEPVSGVCGAMSDAGVETGSDALPDSVADSIADGASDTAIDSASDTLTTDAAPDALPIADVGPVDPSKKPVITGDFQLCLKDSECSSGFCVEGVCCNSRCEDRCHTCSLPSSPGVCTEEPIGVDLKAECGPALSCLGTCGPGAQCIGAGQGTLCGRNECVGRSTGLGPAYCSAPGARCPLEDKVPFDCSPYVCEPVFGACRTQCNASSDCAEGYVCDVQSKSCAQAPNGDTGGAGGDDGCGCTTPGRPAHASWLLALVAALSLRRRRAAARRSA